MSWIQTLGDKKQTFSILNRCPAPGGPMSPDEFSFNKLQYTCQEVSSESEDLDWVNQVC